MTDKNNEDIKEENETNEEVTEESNTSTEEVSPLTKEMQETIDKLKELDLDTLVELLMTKTLEADSNNDKFLRKTADMENFKKRSEKERVDLLAFANEKLILDILPVLDNMERALTHADTETDSALKDGVKLVIDQFSSILTKFGLTQVEAKGKPFDPEFHEAVSHVETTDFENDIVTEELQKGYILNNKVIRHTIVVVAKND